MDKFHSVGFINISLYIFAEWYKGVLCLFATAVQVFCFNESFVEQKNNITCSRLGSMGLWSIGSTPEASGDSSASYHGSGARKEMRLGENVILMLQMNLENLKFSR